MQDDTKNNGQQPSGESPDSNTTPPNPVPVASIYPEIRHRVTPTSISTSSPKDDDIAATADGLNLLDNSKSSKSKKPKIIAIIVAVILVFILGGGTAFAFWYQNPNKVIADSLVNIVLTKNAIYNGNLTTSNDGNKVDVEITAKQANVSTGSLDANVKFTYKGKTYQPKGSIIYDSNNDLYLRVKDITEFINGYKSDLGLSDSDVAVSDLINKLVSRIDGTWIKISSDDLKTYSEDYAAKKTCSSNVLSELRSDAKQLSEVADLYVKNQFITSSKDLGLKDGSFGYQIKSDDSKLKSFINGLSNTAVYKNLHQCDETFKLDANSIVKSDDSKNTATVELWSDVWSHKMTKLSLTGKDDGDSYSLVVKPDYKVSKPEIKAPEKFTTLKQLQSYYTEFINSLYQ